MRSIPIAKARSYIKPKWRTCDPSSKLNVADLDQVDYILSEL